MTEKTPPESDTVGYKNPPQATRFKPGQSGNPKGRPKGAKNFITVINDELKTQVIVTENGKRKTISKRQAIIKQLVNKAAGGDPKAIPIILSETRPHENQPGAAEPDDLAAEDEALLAHYLKNGGDV